MYSSCEGSCGEEMDFYDILEARLQQMTMLAHKEILFEKIKARIQEQEGEKLDRIVDLLLENSKKDADLERESDQRSDELKDRLRDLFEE